MEAPITPADLRSLQNAAVWQVNGAQIQQAGGPRQRRRRRRPSQGSCSPSRRSGHSLSRLRAAARGLVTARSSYRLIVGRNLQPSRFVGGRPRLQSRGLGCLQRWHPSPPWRQPIRRRKNPPPRPCEAGALSHFGRFCPFAARGEPQRCNFRMRETRAVRVCIGSKRFPVPYTSVVSIIRRV